VSIGSMWLRNSYYSYVFSFRGSFGAAYRPLNLVTTDSLAGKAGTASIKTGGEMRKTRVNTGFHAHAESVGKLRRLRKSRYSLNNPETWARNCVHSSGLRGLPALQLTIFVLDNEACQVEYHPESTRFLAAQSLLSTDFAASVSHTASRFENLQGSISRRRSLDLREK